jgi:nucleoside-diphosphate-sugar epimerase
MRVFVAGATGAIGRPLVDALLAGGHAVIGTTRDRHRADALLQRGAQGVVLDAFDAAAVQRAVLEASPDVLVHQLTALPAAPDPKAMAAALELTARLRRETVPVFLAAAAQAGARKAVVQSISFVTQPDGRPVHDEDAPLYHEGREDLIAAAGPVAAIEAACDAATLPALVLRYGFFYGPGTWYARDGALGAMIAKRRFPIIGDGRGRMSFVHVDDAVAATVAAVEGSATGVLNVCDDEPAATTEWLPHAARCLGAKPPRHAPAWLARRLAGDGAVHYATTLPGNANGRARAALDWSPRSWRDGFAEAFA